MARDVSKPMSEAAALLEILDWSLERPPWQRDALRRLVVNGQLTEDDYDELTAICLDLAQSSVPLGEKHLGIENPPGKPVRLLGIKNPIAVNALASGQSLNFAEEGLTIVYGDNGSGKSGYVRILKHACRSRDNNIKILSDVASLEDKPQSARILFKCGSSDRELEWSPQAASNTDLSSVSVFDSRSANTHVESTNNVAYTPFPMQVLEHLATACDFIKETISGKIVALEQQSPKVITSSNLSTSSPAGAFVHSISAKSNLATLEMLSTISTAEKERYLTLDSDLTQDSQRTIARLSALNSRLNKSIATLQVLHDAVSETSISHLRSLREKRDRATAQAASEKLFSSSPLPEIGGELWQELWEAARHYSDKIAYPETLFPAAGLEGQLCVLCQQPLGADAVVRHLTFEEFVKGTTKNDEIAAIASYDAEIAKAKAAIPQIGIIREMHRLIYAELEDRALAITVRRAIFSAIRQLSDLIDEQEEPRAAEPMPLDILISRAADINERIEHLSADADSPERQKIVAEHLALKERLALREIEADVRSEISRASEIAVLKIALKSTAKVSVTKKNKELSEKLITDVLRNRFAREVEKLKIGTMPIELRKEKDKSATSYFRVAFVAQPREPLGDVLSEGEHRCVALAAFLAELVTSREYSGIVFDDPMSSLDHLYRRNVAGRLVEEAAHRQVIIFTHDLSFLFEILREADGRNIATHFQTFQRKDGIPGFVESDLPMKAKHAAPLAHAIRIELKSLKGQYNDWPEARRTIIFKGIIEQLREAWDQAIADFIFPVLGRFDSQIRGSSLYKLSVLTDEDVQIVTAARARLSEDLHAAPDTLNPESVTHADLSAETNHLIGWLDDIGKRQKDATKPKALYS